MPRFFLSFLNVLFSSLFSLAVIGTVMAAGEIKKLSVSQEIDTMLADWQGASKAQAAGLAIKVSQGEGVIYERYFGLANLATYTPITPETRFQIASVSKQFTAFAIALLANQGKLSMDDDIRTHLPEFPDYGAPISILSLVHHTGGLRDLDDLNGIIGIGFTDYNDTQDVYALLKRQSAPNFEPGERFDYSNSGYVVLAKIVESVTGLTFKEFMAKEVFAPIGMRHTQVFDNAFEVLEHRATGYFSNDGVSFSRDNGLSAVYGSTGVYTTLNDLDAWARNFLTPKVGNPAVFELMKTTGVLNNHDVTSYAFGQELKTINGHQALFHGGGTGAFRSYLLRVPAQQLSISVLSNNSYSTAFIIQYVNEIAQLMLPLQAPSAPLPLTDKPDTEISVSDVSNYIGDYQIQPGLIFSVTSSDDKLTLTISGNDQRIPLSQVGQHEFMLMDSNNGYRMVFNAEATPSASIQYYQGDFEYRGKRLNLVDFDAQAQDPKEYQGVYYSPDLNTVYTIKSVEGTLTATHARNAPITLTAFQPDLFNSSTPFFQEVRFTRTDKGHVDGMKVSGSRSKNIAFFKTNQLHR